MRRRLTRAYQALVDLTVLTTALVLAFFFRFDWEPPAPIVGRIILLTPYVVLFEYAVLRLAGIHRLSWRYVGMIDAARIAVAITGASIVLLAARLLMGELQYDFAYFRHGVVPLGVVFGNHLLAIMGLVGARALRRILGERIEGRRALSSLRKSPVRTMLVGAGSGGARVAEELMRSPNLGIEPVGFIDDDPAKQGMMVHGVRVLGITEDLAALCARHRATQVLITIASATGSSVRRIRAHCEAAELPVKIIPALHEIVAGRVNLTRIRDVAIEDLLRREPVQLDEGGIAEVVTGKTVMVTGAGGSIGSELCRQVATFAPRALLLVERAENNLFDIHRELRSSAPEVKTVPLLGDVTDRDRMDAIFAAHQPSVVLHAAAHKHVPMVEWNPGEAVKNNVLGTRTVVELADRHRAETFVLVSTDKAVNPTSIMGATKRAAEILVQSSSQRSKTRFVTVRFGNVLGSTGSVVPIFKAQIAAGGPITVTHPEMKRYFMTIPEACQLVLQAASMGDGGEIFILDMGEPVRIIDLAHDLIALSGLRVGEDVEIHFSGPRPGEKLFEELSTDAEHADRTGHPKVFVGRHAMRKAEDVARALDALAARGVSSRRRDLVHALRALVPEFEPASEDSVPAPPAENSSVTPLGEDPNASTLAHPRHV